MGGQKTGPSLPICVSCKNASRSNKTATTAASTLISLSSRHCLKFLVASSSWSSSFRAAGLEAVGVMTQFLFFYFVNLICPSNLHILSQSGKPPRHSNALAGACERFLLSACNSAFGSGSKAATRVHCADKRQYQVPQRIH